jgi:hypothetical protein
MKKSCVLSGELSQVQIKFFLDSNCYQAWGNVSDSRLSGVSIDGTDYAVHQYMSVIYSPEVTDWLKGGRVGNKQCHHNQLHGQQNQLSTG